jgi:hypothetical protein
MRLVCNLKDLLSQHGITATEFAAETHIDPRSIDNLLQDEKWRLERQNFERLMLYGFNHGWGPIFTIEQHPIWDTFHERRASIYRGTAQWDGQIEHEVSQFLRHLGCTPHTENAHPTPRAVAAAMRENNCIFIGSPKKNTATEIALCLLADAEPFNPAEANRRKLPVQIIGVDPPSGTQSAVLVPNQRIHGFSVRRGKSDKRESIGVDWLPQEEYDSWHGDANDAAMVITCRSPLGTTKDVQTILFLGYSGLATQSVARKIMQGDPETDPPLKAADLAERGKVQMFAYRFQFTKPTNRAPRSKTDPRREIAKTGYWWP